VVLGLGVVAGFLALDLVSSFNGGWWPVPLVVVAVAAAAGWARLPQTRPARRLLGRPVLAALLWALVTGPAGVSVLNFLVPYLWTEAEHASPVATGLALLAFSLAMAAVSPAAGLLADRRGNMPVALAGMAVILAGSVVLFADVVTGLVLMGVGNGLFAGPLSAAVLRHTPPELNGTSGGVSALARNFGFALGPALGSLAWTWTGGGAAGFRMGALAVVLLTATGTVATGLAWRRESRSGRVP
ncbi:MFS transporter, partial [Amycolatopsis rhizosphaerae]